MRKHTLGHAPSEDSNQPMHLQSDQSLCSPHEKTLHPWLSMAIQNVHPVKTQINMSIHIF